MNRSICRAAPLIAWLLTSAGCLLPPVRIPPPPSRPATQPLASVRVDANEPWTDAGVIVERGERLVFWATGEIALSASPQEVLGPDGKNGMYYSVGKGGLIGMIDDQKPFTIGARTHLFRRGGKGSHLPFTPPPIEMKRAGVLKLGFKNWKPGLYSGAFLVEIWQAP